MTIATGDVAFMPYLEEKILNLVYLPAHPILEIHFLEEGCMHFGYLDRSICKNVIKIACMKIIFLS